MIVVYHPEGDFLGRFETVGDEVAHVVFVLNDGLPASRIEAARVSSHSTVFNPSNRGLGCALNQGIAEALGLGFEWVLLLDQDTTVLPGLVEGLANVYDAVAPKGDIGQLVANYRNPLGERVAYDADKLSQEVPTAVTSGSLVPLARVRQVGGMKESFFIEGIDLEFCLRLRSHGYRIYASGKVLMLHGAGQSEPRRFLGRTVLVGHHAPWRVRLQLRNLVWTLLRYGAVDWAWTANTVMAIVKKLVLIVTFEADRTQKCWAALLGMSEGLAGQIANPLPADESRIL